MSVRLRKGEPRAMYFEDVLLPRWARFLQSGFSARRAACIGKMALVCLLVLCTGPTSARGEAPSSYRDTDELVVAVNARLEKLGHPAFTEDGLLVRIATKLDAMGEPPGRGFSLLEDMAAKKPFRYPVTRVDQERHEIKLTEETISLPAHTVLEIRVLNVPWGSVDKEGNRLKVTWHAIPIATALAKE